MMKILKRAIKHLIKKWEAVCCFIKEASELARLIFIERSFDNIEYKDLAPVDDVPECKVHVKALEWAFSKTRIKNIALAGPYGSGKSSIINAFLKQNPLIADKSICVSLATFTDAEGNKAHSGHSDIERGVLKQLFYKVEQHKIPQSRYRKIHRVRYIRVFMWTICCVAAIGAVTFIFLPDTIKSAYDLIVSAADKVSIPLRSMFFALGVIAFVLIAIVSKLLQLFAYRISIKEIKLTANMTIKDSGIEKESAFDKNIDEIVYFFEETGIRTVFFEDLDRFKDTEIFIQLRELNTLLNNYDAIDQPIVFVYAIRDDVFTDVDRTKFFEFIIPVIPVINSTNSGEILLEMLCLNNGKACKHEISHNYILDISPFISDMRVLQNIYNEFLIYKTTLKTGQSLTLNDELMMSVVVFKNLYPKQFSDLQGEQGVIKQAFKDKILFIEKLENECSSQIEELTKILNNIEKEHLQNIREVKHVMLCAMSGGRGIVSEVRLNGGASHYADIILRDDFNMSELLKSGNWYTYYLGYRGGKTPTGDIKINEVCAPYVERINYLSRVREEDKAKIKEKIAELKTQTHIIANWSLKKLIDKFGTEKILSSDVRANELLVFMLRKGYIDEKYADYINFFKGNSITTEDMNFILSVKNQRPNSYTYSISRRDQVLSRLQLHEFAEKACLNFELLEQMLSSNEYNDKLAVLIGQLSNESTDSWKFIDEFIDYTNYERRFIKLLADNWFGLWDAVYHNNVLTYERKIRYLSSLFYCLNMETLSALNRNGSIVKFFIEHDDILQSLPKDLAERISQIITEFKICFQQLKVTGVSPQLLDFIFDNQHYELNVDMIRSIVEHKGAHFCDRLDLQNYTAITELGYGELLDHVHQKLEMYVDNVVLRETNVEESMQCVDSLLERMIEDIPRCKKVIIHENIFVVTLTSMCHNLIETNRDAVLEIWDTLISNKKVSVTWENVYDYWREYGLTVAIMSFLTLNADKLLESDFNCLEYDFKLDIIKSDLEKSIFSKLLPCIQMEDFDIPLAEIDDEKLEVMIQQHYFEFSSDTYSELAQCAPELRAEFILQNQEQYWGNIDDVVLDEAVFEKLLLSDRTEDVIKKHIIARDGAELITSATAQKVLSMDMVIGKEVFAKTWEKLSNSQERKKLMFKHLRSLTEEDFEVYFEAIGAPYNCLKRDVSRRDVMIPDTLDNRALAERLKQINFVTSYDFEEQERFDVHHNIIRESVIRYRLKARQ